jgi:mannose-6-phosphate isomerase-like protein (cupin superfamily)
MAGTGDTLMFPDGSDYTITASAGDTNGTFVEMEVLVPPHAVTPPLHIHPRQQEEYEVLAGTLDVLLDGRWQSLPEGEEISVPRGSPHTFRNNSGVRVRFRNVHKPALGFQDYLEELHGLVQEGKVKDFKSLGSLIYISLLMERHDETIVPAGAPRRAATRLLAGLGRRLRYRL